MHLGAVAAEASLINDGFDLSKCGGLGLGIRTARALAEDLPPAVAQHSANPSSVEDAFAAGVGQIKPDARRGAFQRLVRTRTARVLSEQNLDSDANTNL